CAAASLASTREFAPAASIGTCLLRCLFAGGRGDGGAGTRGAADETFGGGERRSHQSRMRYARASGGRVLLLAARFWCCGRLRAALPAMPASSERGGACSCLPSTTGVPTPSTPPPATTSLRFSRNATADGQPSSPVKSPLTNGTS